MIEVKQETMAEFLKHCDGVHANARTGSLESFNLRVLNR